MPNGSGATGLRSASGPLRQGQPSPLRLTPTVTVERHSSITVSTATLIAALVLATCSAAFSISGLTSIFAGAFWPVIGLGVAFELGKLSAVAWLGHAETQTSVRYGSPLPPSSPS